MLSLVKCLKDVANFVQISVGTQTGSLKIGMLLVQWGTSSKSLAAKDADRNLITFPKAYTAIPIVLTQGTVVSNFAGLFLCGNHSATKTQFYMVFHNQYSQSATITGVWLAIGRA